ncbi:MAG: hypothetical protein IT370_24935 [Deltaproteobacteria bacterium]|nr:hypothetical protein [Deltaproteobacteria bacterium]
MSVRFQPADRRGEVVVSPLRSLPRLGLDFVLFAGVILGLPWLWLGRWLLPAARQRPPGP